ncbi:stAR-related lipid transfer protein 3, partial [Biomphalaria glabrata]
MNVAFTFVSDHNLDMNVTFTFVSNHNLDMNVAFTFVSDHNLDMNVAFTFVSDHNLDLNVAFTFVSNHNLDMNVAFTFVSDHNLDVNVAFTFISDHNLDMNVTFTFQDVRLVDSDRDQQAKEAGHLIYSSIRSDTDSSVVTLPTNSHPARMPPPVPEVRSERYSLGQGRMSTVRRTFCLFVLFDLILTFILWVIYTQLIGLDGYKAFDDQVLHYDFKFSLFDSVMLAVYRFTLLLLAYALFKLQHWWVIAITTATTCAVLIAKIFVFDFQGSKTNNNPLSYCLIIISFVLAWAETWFLDFKVLPQEQKALDRLRLSSAPNYGSIYIPVQASGLRPDDMQSLITEDNQFYSPVESPADSDAEEEPQGVTKGDRTSEYLSAQSSKQPTRQ